MRSTRGVRVARPRHAPGRRRASSSPSPRSPRSIPLPANWLATAHLVWRDTATNVRTPLGPVDAFEGDLAAPGWEADARSAARLRGPRRADADTAPGARRPPTPGRSSCSTSRRRRPSRPRSAGLPRRSRSRRSSTARSSTPRSARCCARSAGCSTMSAPATPSAATSSRRPPPAFSWEASPNGRTNQSTRAERHQRASSRAPSRRRPCASAPAR